MPTAAVLLLPVKALAPLADVLGIEGDAQEGQLFQRALKMFAIATEDVVSRILGHPVFGGLKPGLS